MRCLILLFIVGSAMAQPEWYGLWTTDHTISDIEICVRADTADILWIQDGVGQFDSTTARYIPYDLNQESLLHDPLEVYYSGWPYIGLIDLTAASTERWACLFHTRYHSGSGIYGTFNFLTEMQYGNANAHQSIEVEASSYHSFPDNTQGNWSEGHALRVHDGRIGVAYADASIGPFDVWYSTVYKEYTSDFTPALEGGLSIGGGYNEPLNRAIGIPIPGDSVFFYSDFGFGGWWQLYVGPSSGFNDQEHYQQVTCGDSRILRAMYLTASNRIIAAFVDNSLHQIIPGEEGEATCEPFAELPTDWSPSWAFHPSYGFAALQVHHARLFLARIDTTGAEVQPVGILYETDGEHFIVDADVTITDSGQVVAVWSEYTDWSDGPRELKIGWTNWDTFLDTPEQGVPSVPRELTLSAYPNPFNSTVTISFDLQRSAPVSLAIFDIQGRLVETLRDETTQAGQHTIAWLPKELSSGVYFARLDAADISKTAKLLYLK